MVACRAWLEEAADAREEAYEDKEAALQAQLEAQTQTGTGAQNEWAEAAADLQVAEANLAAQQADADLAHAEVALGRALLDACRAGANAPPPDPTGPKPT